MDTTDASSGAPSAPSAQGAASVHEQVTARHNRWVWFNAGMIVLGGAIALIFGADWGAFWLAGLLVIAGAVRLVTPGPGLAGLTVRSRYLDSAMFWAAAAALTFLAATAPLI